jgi:methionyl-tRNA formyltransferase
MGPFSIASMPNTVLFGHGSLGLAMAKGLLATPDVNLRGVYPWCDHPGSSAPTFHAKLDAPLLQWAKQHDIPVLALGKTHDAVCLDWLAANHITWIQLACWGEIIKPPLLHTPGIHIINCHPGRLPWHKGPNPYASVIRANETQTAVTFHRVDAGIDTGPVVLQVPVPISPMDTGGHVQAKTDAVAGQSVHLLVQNNRFMTDAGAPQSDAGSYYANFNPYEALIQWRSDPAAVERNSRALQPWVDPFAYWNGDTQVTFKRLRLIKATETPALPAGTLIAVSQTHCRVASCDANWQYRLEGYRLAMGNRFLPHVLSQAVGLWMLRPAWGSFWHTPMLETPY